MTRGIFMEKMLETIFGTKYIEFKKTADDVVWYTKGGSLCKDCTYSNAYQKHIEDILDPLFDSQYTLMCIKINNHSQPELIKHYQQKALDLIFKLKVFREVEAETMDAIKKSMALQNMGDIYHDIIIKTLFDIGDQKKGRARANDDFDESLAIIGAAVLKYIHEELPALQERNFKNLFFRKIAEKYPVFLELHLEEDNKIVEKQLRRQEKSVDLIYSEFDVNLFSQMELIEIYTTDLNELSVYADKPTMTDESFLDLDMKLDTLLTEVSGYRALLSQEKIMEFKNVAVRVYNHLYGVGHPVYEDVVFLAAWNAHEKYLDYLLMLSLVLREYEGR